MRFRVAISRKVIITATMSVVVSVLASVGTSAREINPADPITEFKKRQNFTPSTVTLKRAQEIFGEMKHLPLQSTDYQRAYSWSHQLFEGQIQTMKVVLYLTPHYRNEYLWQDNHAFGIRKPTYHQYEVRAHTAPVVYVLDPEAGYSTPTPMVLDRALTPGPMSLDDWSHYLMQTRRAKAYSGRTLTREETHCAIIDNYRDYAVPALQDQGPIESNDPSDFMYFQKRHERDPWCMMRIAPWYYYADVNIQLMDCDPARDPNFTAGFTSKRGRDGVGSEALVKINGHFNYVCAEGAPVTISDFDSTFLK